ncbi:MAG: glutamate racemase [Candidatus Omnitrophica bacterium]|nr:glutamate racemase [Candidatus Omnitrophota bacterium]MDD5670260.1 glutamate racemase [Candidatus Omnitrophota bacterium]
MSQPLQGIQNRSIGVFDSGLGGLTVVKELRREMPHESIVYFGDIARLPYGIKSKEQILNFSIQNTLFLLKQKVKAIVVACNSSSSAAYHFLRDHFGIPIIDVIMPAVEAAACVTHTGRVGLIATHATVASQAYERSLRKINPNLRIFSRACSLFVPVVEEGWLEDPITEQIVRRYLGGLRHKNIDTLILGCTHYPMLKASIRKVLGPRVQLIDSARPSVKKLKSILIRQGLVSKSKRKGELRVFVSDMPRNFKQVGEKFLGEKLHKVQIVRGF